ncbi:MAG: ATPase domain-containing protein [Candidatus Woesearchaeota archaeon]
MVKLVEKKSDIKRIKTYIEGYDQHLEGGIPAGHVVLVTGPAGSMKSSFCFNILFNEAKAGKTALFISLEQSVVSFLNHAISLNFDLSEINILVVNDLARFGSETEKIKGSQKGSLVFVDIGAIRKEIKDIRMTNNRSWINVVKNIIKKLKTEANCDLFVLDSLSALYVLSNFENPRIELYYLFEFLRDANMTSLLVSEGGDQREMNKSHGIFEVEDYLSDGIFHLRLSEFRRKVLREISVVKMRATKCNHDIFSLEVDHGKFMALYGGQNPLL